MAGLRGLIFTSDKGVVTALMLFVFYGTLFAGVQFAITIMAMTKDAPSPGGRRRMPQRIAGRLVPIKMAEHLPTKR